MKQSLRIPPEVRNSIAEHVRQAVAKFQRDYSEVSTAEDSLTVKLGCSLLTKRTKAVEVPNSGTWRWQIDYKKFADRGRDAEEKVLGADGFLEINTDRRQELGRKGALFQCKVEGRSSQNLVDQVAKLSNWREAAFIIFFSEGGTTVSLLDDVVRNGGKFWTSRRIPLDQFLIEHFLECLVGDSDLQYFANRKLLAWRTVNHRSVYAKFQPKSRIRVNVTAPRRRYVETPLGDSIPFSEVHLSRMDSALVDETVDSLKDLLKIYHPDKFASASSETRWTFEQRTREILSELERLKSIEASKTPVEPSKPEQLGSNLNLDPSRELLSERIKVFRDE